MLVKIRKSNPSYFDLPMFSLSMPFSFDLAPSKVAGSFLGVGQFTVESMAGSSLVLFSVVLFCSKLSLSNPLCFTKTRRIFGQCWLLHILKWRVWWLLKSVTSEMDSVVAVIWVLGDFGLLDHWLCWMWLTRMGQEALNSPALFWMLLRLIQAPSPLLQDTNHSLCLSDLSLMSTDSELRDNSDPVSISCLWL